MSTRTHGCRFGTVSAWMLSLWLVSPSSALAQAGDYTAGQRIEYRSSGYPEVWEEATYLRATPDGAQPIIRQTPTQFQPEGAQRAASWAEIRPLATEPAGAPRPAEQAAPASRTESVPADPIAEHAEAPRADHRGGPMTQTEVLAILATLGPDPFQNPRREQVKLALAEMIKARGLDFRYSTSGREFNEGIGRVGATSDLVFPLRDNYGPPTERAELMGRWTLSKIGASVDYVVGDRLYRQGEIGVANIGSLFLEANGGFEWQTTTADPIRGRWRPATAAEMKSQGGEGIVLLAAKSGYDWIVTRNRNTTLAGRWIGISELSSRQINEHGSRP